MSELSKKVNSFFLEATRTDVEKLKNDMLISDHLYKVFEMRYIQNKDINFIAYTTGYSRGKIEADLRKIRKKISKLI